MTSFNLSEKIMRISKKYRDFDCIDIKDVKEFIRLLKEKCNKNCDECPFAYINGKCEIDKLAGEKLK